MRWLLCVGCSVPVLMAVACSSTSVTEVGATAGGSTSIGGSSGTGGAKSIGGASSTAGSNHVGGTSSTAGATSIGGASPSGGRSNVGGVSNLGGTSNTAGATAKGGALSNGGNSSTGGATLSGGTSSAAVTGGSPATGGSIPVGGATATGGGSNTGGKTSTGGSQAAGGATNSGGKTSTGGITATGGSRATGGAATGGAATGGAATGGAATGGAATGGAPCNLPNGTLNKCTASCPCNSGQGQCADSTGCVSPLVCAVNTGLKFGFTGNACVPAHCDDNSADGDETSIDCGGSCGCRATYVGLGALYRGTAEVTGVSGNGLVAVGYSTYYGPPENPSRWDLTSSTPAASFVSLPAQLVAPGQSVATNFDGSVVVGWGTCASSPCTNTGFYAVNASSSILSGQMYDAASVSADGTVILDSLGSIWTNGIVTSSGLQIGYAVSGNGLVFGGAVMQGPQYVAATWTSAGGIVNFGILSGSGGSNVYALNKDGSVAVGASASLSGGQAFRWTSGGGMYGLGFLPNSSSSTARDVSDDGAWVVGDNVDNNLTTTAWVWDATTAKMRSLADELASRGYELPAGTQLQYAVGISADGTVIVGNGTDSNGTTPWRIVLLK